MLHRFTLFVGGKSKFYLNVYLSSGLLKVLRAKFWIREKLALNQVITKEIILLIRNSKSREAF